MFQVDSAPGTGACASSPPFARPVPCGQYADLREPGGVRTRPFAHSGGDWLDHVDHAFGGDAFNAGLARAVPEAMLLAAAVLLAPLWILGIADLLQQAL